MSGPASMPIESSTDNWIKYGMISSAIGRVIVPAVSTFDCPASLALRTEWVPHEVTLLGSEDEYAYAGLMAETWRSSYGFIVVEHDIVPWAGALYQLWHCPRPWCGFFYPMQYGMVAGSLGCTKFSAELVLERPHLADTFLGHAWDGLDGVVTKAAGKATGQQFFHAHQPAVGHARARSFD